MREERRPLPRECRDEVLKLREAIRHRPTLTPTLDLSLCLVLCEAMQGHARIQKMLRQASVELEEKPRVLPKPTREVQPATTRPIPR